MNNTIVSPAEYFEQVKSRKRTMTADGLSQLYENCLALLEEYQRSGQIAAQKKLLFHIDNITREKKLLDLGIDTFVYKSDVDDFIHMVEGRQNCGAGELSAADSGRNHSENRVLQGHFR